MERIYYKTCSECNTQFTSNSTGRKYCSDACKQKGKLRVGAEYRRKKAEENGKKMKRQSTTLADDVAEARKLGVSYGHYKDMMRCKNKIVRKW